MSTDPGHIKAFDPATDAEAVIELIQESFNLQNEPESQLLIQQMRQSAQRYSDSGNFATNTTIQPGYVWLVDGQIVGNINIFSFLDKLRHIALIANVAVKPEYQGLGIAKALTRHALRYAEKKRAAEVWLQVSSDNQRAKNLYSNLGFESIRSLNNWVIDKAKFKLPPMHVDMPPLYEMSKRRFTDWPNQKSWLEVSYPADTRWYDSVGFGQFPPFAWLNPLNLDSVGSLHHFALRKSKELLGVLSWQKTIHKLDHIKLAFPQNADEEAHILLLLGMFMENEQLNKTTQIEYPSERGESAFSKLGLRLNRRLDWMKWTRPR
jgi:ribosomal protein S18 acetylase RimI-like enzyme